MHSVMVAFAPLFNSVVHDVSSQAVLNTDQVLLQLHLSGKLTAVVFLLSQISLTHSFL